MLTDVNRVTRHLTYHPNCPLCGMHEETMLHRLRDCNLVRSIWESIDSRLVQRNFFNLQLSDWLKINIWHQSPAKQGTPWPLLFATTCNVLWHTRNLFVFEDQVLTHQEVLNKCLWLAYDYHLTQQSLSFAKKKIFEFVIKQVRWQPPPMD